MQARLNVLSLCDGRKFYGAQKGRAARPPERKIKLQHLGGSAGLIRERTASCVPRTFDTSLCIPRRVKASALLKQDIAIDEGRQVFDVACRHADLDKVRPPCVDHPNDGGHLL
ncbi:MAG: hypothetical protein Q8L16_19510, partial [Hydrogenophaga sp.]|nr:hypothetical protein [Hydrogenophaga sp.]